MLRACSMTLVVLAEESRRCRRPGRDPRRADAGASRAHHRDPPDAAPASASLAERVYAQCWMPFGQRRQICCEQIEITASDAALPDLPSVVLPLAVPDLPVILWCRSAAPAGHAGVPRDRGHGAEGGAGSAPMPRCAMPPWRRVADVARSGVLLGDLSWTRLTRWREMLSQVFENRRNLALRRRTSRSVHGEFRRTRHNACRVVYGAWVLNALARCRRQRRG